MAGVGLCAGCKITIGMQVQLRLTALPTSLRAGLFDDYIHLKALMQYGSAIVEGTWVSLNTELTSARLQQGMFPEPHDERFDNPKDYSSYVRLSRALEYYEGLCWFPINRITFPGLLSTNEFLGSLPGGFAKDPGAGPAHGDLSHRFQWHAVMRIVTNNFTQPVRAGWTFTPVELYLSLFEPISGAAWAYIFDLPGLGTDAYSHPDNVLQGLRNGNQWPLIRPNLIRRADKRINFDTAIQAGMQGVPVNKRPSGNIPVANIRQKIYTWKKVGGGPPQIQLPSHGQYTEDQYAFAVWQHIKRTAPELLSSTHILREEIGAPNIITSRPATSPMRTIDINNNFTVLKVHSGLNTLAYTYNAQRGARPV
jgi:hypothetical protein